MGLSLLLVLLLGADQANPIVSHRAVDGDTVEVTVDLGYDIHFLTAVRLTDVDCPESHHTNPVHKTAGEAVKDVTAAWLAAHSNLWLIPMGRDKYGGRVLGVIVPCSPPRRSALNDFLLENKLAHPCPDGHRKAWTDQELLEILARAREVIAQLKGTPK